MTTRPRSEIMRDLKAILAELDFAMHGPELPSADDPSTGSGDISPKLEQALRQSSGQALEATKPKTHEEIRQQARAYKPTDYSDIRPDEVTRREKPERLRDYKQVDDPDWPPDSVWMGTGDHKLIE